ncbi:MAG: YicC family protein [Betaproteobacteria bacterium RIFCSPLOWO2_02_FULL_67_19]|nr:MAG: YicC family protein [Betaproteobacteria bacterium RIFCSPLOWO2_02_FULL_67_19]
MIHSMTGYATVTADLPRGTLALELRSVNSRYLDIQLRIAEELRAAEPALRELIGARIARGKVDCRISFSAGASAAAQGSLNAAALESLHRLAGEARRAFPDAAPLRLADVLRWPGVIAEAPQDEAALRATVLERARHALDELCAAREREGAKLAQNITARVAEMERRIAEVAPLVPEAVIAFQAKLAQRLREALGSTDDERVRAEIAVFGMKSDVDEELTRLAAHLGEVRRTLARGGPVGKRLDFLAQELNREANTLASKAAGARIADGALELKLLIEQMREQVQNIE